MWVPGEWAKHLRAEATQGSRPLEWSQEMMMNILLWCILLVLCWPLALLALVLYPIVWLLLLPFRILGIAVDGVFDLLRGILLLPGRILRGPRSA
jgi:hypothetical protein